MSRKMERQPGVRHRDRPIGPDWLTTAPGAELVIEGARLIAGSPFPETNAQLSNNFLVVSLHKAPDAERQRMKQMWFDAGLGNLSWPPTSIRVAKMMPGRSLT